VKRLLVFGVGAIRDENLPVLGGDLYFQITFMVFLKSVVL
jgi:hypothetical protein